MNRGDGSRAIVFDLDGTLVDMRALYLRANQLATKDVLGVELSEHEVHELMATGLPLRAAMRTLDENSARSTLRSGSRAYVLMRNKSSGPTLQVRLTAQGAAARG